MNRLSEQVRRLEDTIESLIAENKKLREPQQLPQISYKWKVTERPEEWEEGDLYYVELSDWTICEVIRYNGELIPFSIVREMYDKNNYTKKLETELKARVEQVENLQDTLKKITKENLELQDKNKRLKSKLEQTVDEYDEDYKTYHRDEDKFDDNFRKIFRDFLDDKF